MSGILDFLFEGQPPPSVTTYGQTTQNVPQWYSDYTQGLLNRANQVASVPYQQYQGPRIAGFTPSQNQAFGEVQNLQGAYQPYIGSAQGWLSQAAGSNPAEAVSPYVGEASGYLSQSTNPTGMNAASPFLTAASGRFNDPATVSSYMDPYVENVISRAGTLAGRQFNEQILPGIEDTFSGAGQYGSSRMREVTDRASRDLAEGLQGQAQAALSQAYGTAGNLFNADQNRMAQLGSTAGQLGTAQQQSLQGAASGLGNLSNIYGNILGNTANTKLQAGQAEGNLAQLFQNLGLQGASALGQTGAIQQAQNQGNLDLAYQDFQNQLNYPRSNIDWLSGVLRGYQVPTSTQTTQQSPLPGSQYGASGLSQIGAAASTLKNLWDLFGGGG